MLGIFILHHTPPCLKIVTVSMKNMYIKLRTNETVKTTCYMFKEQNHLFILPIYHGRVEDINNIKHGRTQLKGALNAPCMLHWIDDDFELK